jgi:fructokinase
MREVYTIGETTFDIIFKNDIDIEAKVGGSLLNTSISLGRLGISVNFLSSIGKDKVGEKALFFINKNNVNTNYINRFEGKSRIALAFLDVNKNADYSFYAADEPELFTVKRPAIKENDVILFGSSFALKPQVRTWLVDFISYARDKKAIIVYDPNIRKTHIDDIAAIMPYLEENFALADIIKGSNEDFNNIFNINEADATYKILKTVTNAILIYTYNKEGIWLCNHNFVNHYPVNKIVPISTIGAGDTFNAGLVYSLITNDVTLNALSNISETLWIKMLTLAADFAQEVCLSYDNYLSIDYIKRVM